MAILKTLNQDLFAIDADAALLAMQDIPAQDVPAVDMADAGPAGDDSLTAVSLPRDAGSDTGTDVPGQAANLIDGLPTDGDGLAGLSITALNAVRAEGSGAATAFTFKVTRSGNLDIASSAHWKVAGGAFPGADAADFLGGILPSGTVSFAPDETSKIVTVQVAGDSANEDNESFTVRLSAPSTGTALVKSTASGLIANDDMPTLSIAATDAIKGEGDTGHTATMTFTVTRTGNLTETNSAPWWIHKSGSQIPPSGTPVLANKWDFMDGQELNGNVVFAPGEATKTITLDVRGDRDVETDEIVEVEIGATAWNKVGTAVATGKILNDDHPSHLSFDAAASMRVVNEGDSGNVQMRFVVTRQAETWREAGAYWKVTPGAVHGATADDFAYSYMPNGSVYFAPGETQKYIVVDVAGDHAIESDETFQVSLFLPNGNTVIDVASVTATIANDDLAHLLEPGQDSASPAGETPDAGDLVIAMETLRDNLGDAGPKFVSTPEEPAIGEAAFAIEGGEDFWTREAFDFGGTMGLDDLTGQLRGLVANLGDEAAGGSAGGIAMDWRDGADPRGMLLAKESYA